MNDTKLKISSTIELDSRHTAALISSVRLPKVIRR